MNLILYEGERESSLTRLLTSMESTLSIDEIEVFRSIESLKERILQPTCEHTVVVVITGNRGELLDLLSLSDFLHSNSKVRLILVLPDEKPETINIGYKLHPRFLSYIDSDFSEVLAVMGEMFENFKRSKGEQKGR